jgi:glucan 1,3-beta-glucosidase
MDKIRGVNLGGWLVLEKWMTPSLFAGTSAVDEYTFCRRANPEQIAKLGQHHASFITEADFKWIAAHGMNAVRLPIGYWSFGGVEPFISTEKYINATFTWAKKHGLQVLLSVHGVPGSQNGQDHSGRVGPIGWQQEQANIDTTLRFVRQLADRYGNHPALWGIELLNEPSPTIRKRILKRYYVRGYQVIREVAGKKPRVIISDGFKPRRFKRVLRAKHYDGSYIDTHQYQVFTDADRLLNVTGHLAKTAGPVAKSLKKMERNHPVIVGEWSAALDGKSLAGLNEAERDLAHKAYGSAQQAIYDTTDGWFYWSYKTETGGPWDYRHCLERGWLTPLS